MPETDPDATTGLLPQVRATQSESSPTPVFVDASGRRRRVAQRLALGTFLAAAGYAVMVVWSLLGGPVAPNSLMPFSAPHGAVSTARPSQSAQASNAAVPKPSSESGARTGTAAATSATPAAAEAPTTASAAAAASVSASATRHRPTTAPGKPTSSPTVGHGH